MEAYFVTYCICGFASGHPFFHLPYPPAQGPWSFSPQSSVAISRSFGDVDFDDDTGRKSIWISPDLDLHGRWRLLTGGGWGGLSPCCRLSPWNKVGL